MENLPTIGVQSGTKQNIVTTYIEYHSSKKNKDASSLPII